MVQFVHGGIYMNPLLKTRSTKGHLVVYDNRVALELNNLGVHKTNSLSFSQVTGVEVNTTMAKIPLFSKGKATVKVFGTGNQTLEIPFVDLENAKKVEELILARIGK